MHEAHGKLFIESKEKTIEMIRKNINIFFCSEMEMSERLIESFQFAIGGETGIPPVGFWLIAIKQYPQLIDFLDSVGFRFDDIVWENWPIAEIDSDSLFLYWWDSLNNIFNRDFDEDNQAKIFGHTCNQQYEKAKQKKRFDIIDCLIASIADKPIMNSAIQLLYSGISGGKEFPYDRFFFSKDWEWTKDIINKLLTWQSNVELIEDQSFVIYRAGNKIKLKPYTQLSLSKIQYFQQDNSDLWLSRGNVIENGSLSFENTLQGLEDLINVGAKEIEFQRFFELNPHLLLMLGNYKHLHPQLVLRQDDGNDLIPDFFLERIDSNYCDLLDIKRPNVNLIRYQKNRLRFKDCVMEAIAQLNEYRNWFDDRVNRDRFQSKYGVNVMKPQAVILIGRQQDFRQNVDTLKLENNLPNWIQLRTYDALLDRAKQWKRFGSLYW